MNKNQTILTAVVVLLIGLLSGTVMVSADSDLYDITQVEVNGIRVSDGEVSQVELGDTADVEIQLEGTGNTSTCPDGDVNDCAVDVQVKVWIGGYENGDIEATSDMFSIEPGVTYTKTLSLDIPDDLDVQDSNQYTLYVEVYDEEESEKEDYEIFAERPSHSLNIIDVIYDASIDAGETMPVEVRVENLGEEKEEDVKVEVSLDGVDSAVDYIDELAAFEEDNADEESSESAYVVLNVGDDAEPGTHELTVTVSYNDGADTLEQSYTVEVNGEDATTESEGTGTAKTTISLSSTSLKGTQGEATNFDLDFANAGSGSETYTVTVNGIEQWATSAVSPSSVLLDAGESQTVAVTLTPNDDAQGNYDFSIQVLDSDGKLVQDIAMSMDVEESSGLFGDTSSMLKVGFIILIVLIIIIGLIVAFRKLKDDDDDEDPLEPKEGQTYY